MGDGSFAFSPLEPVGGSDGAISVVGGEADGETAELVGALAATPTAG
jgi:hypothetical protein